MRKVFLKTTERTHDDASYSHSVRAAKAKKDQDKLATGAQRVPDVIPETRLNALTTTSVRAAKAKKRSRQVSDNAQSVPDVIPETKLKPTHDVAKCSKSVRAAEAKTRS